MTDTTPLRELPAKLREEAAGKTDTAYEDGRVAEKLRCARLIEAALSARDEAGAVAWAADDFYSNHPLPVLHDDPATNMELLVQALTNRLDTARQALAAVAAMQVVQPSLQQVKANAAWAMSETDPRRLLPRSVAYNAIPPASGEAGADGFAQVCDALGIGADARTVGGVLTNIRNLRHFADCLHAIEREFFMAPGEPDDEFPDDEPEPECLVNSWGSTREQYVEQFRSAIRRLAAVAPADMDGWQPIETVPRDGRRVVVWMRDGSFSSASYNAHSEPQATHWMIPTPPATAGKE